MTVISTLAVKLSLLSEDFENGLAGVGNKLDETGQRLRGIGAGLTAGVTAPIVGVGAAAVMLASDLNESLSKVGVVFDDSADGVIAWSETSATAFGMSQQEALDAAGTFGNLLTSMGMTGAEAASISTSFVGLAADLGSFNNVPTADALAAIQAGLVGEYEPLRRFGIVLDAAAVEARAMELGLVDATGAVTEQGKILARQQLIMEQSTNAQGDFARTSGGLANQMKILKARLKDAGAAIGMILMPYVLQLAGIAQSLISRFEGLSDRGRKVVVIVGAFAAALGPAILVAGVFAGALAKIIVIAPKVSKAFKAMGMAMKGSLGPLLIIIAVLAILALVWKKDLFGIRTKITEWFDTFKQGETFAKIKDALLALKRVVLDFAGKALAKAGEWLRRFIDAMRGPALAAFQAFKAAISTVVGVVSLVIGGIIARLDPLKSAFAGIVQMITGVIDVFRNLFEGDLRGAFDAAISIFEGWLQYLSGVGAFLLSILSGVFGVIWDALSGIDWVGFGTTLLGYVLTAISGIAGLAADMATKAGEMFAGFVDWFTNYNWEELGTTLLGHLVTALDMIVGLAGKMATKASEMLAGFVDWFTNYNWETLGTTLLGYVITALDMISGLAAKMATKASEMLAGFVDWFSTYNWAELGTTILGYITKAAGYIFLPLVLYKHGEDLINGLKSGAEFVWNLVGLWLVGLAGKALAAVGDLLGLLVQKGKDLIQGAYDGIVSFWDGTLKPWLSAIGDKVWTALQYIVFPLLLYYYGEDIIDGLLSGIESAWLFVKNWLGLIKGKITGFFSKAIDWLVNTGKDVIGGMFAGIEKAYDTGKLWLMTLGSRVIGAIGNISNILYEAGKGIIQGLWDGMVKVWEDAKAWVGGIGTWIEDNKGPLTVDRVLLEPGGKAIMQGLLRGMQSQEPALQGYLNGLTASIGGMEFATPALGGMSGNNGFGNSFAAGAITINVTGAGDPDAVAASVYGVFSRELGLRNGGI